MKRKLFFASLLALTFPSLTFSQTKTLEGKIKGSVPQGMKVYIMPAGVKQAAPDTVAYGGGRYTAKTSESQFGFYNIITVYHQRQGITPIKLGQGKDAQDLTLSVDTTGARLSKPNKDNKALAAFYDGYARRSKDFWINGKSKSNDELKASLGSYKALADSIISAIKPSSEVAEYLQIWAATLYFESLNSLKFATGHSPADIGINVHDEAFSLLKTIDKPMASLFDSAPGIVTAACQKKGLEERFEEITTLVSDAALQKRAQTQLLNHWVSNFNYQKDFDSGLQTLRTLTAKYNLDGKYLSDFEAKGSAIAGKPFPPEVKLYDADGNEVSFDKFRGKYVYIDLWASWCVPCIKEIPYLKQLEKDLNNGNVAFVSISTDTNTDAWKRKSKQLDLHGNQLINNDNKLTRALNVNAIPRFVIYDPNGKLYNDNAPRPSDTRTKPLLESLGK